MLRLKESIKNRWMSRNQSATTRLASAKPEQSRPRDTARLYTPRIWL